MKESWLQKHSVCVFVCVCSLGVCVTIVYDYGHHTLHVMCAYESAPCKIETGHALDISVVSDHAARHASKDKFLHILHCHTLHVKPLIETISTHGAHPKPQKHSVLIE